MITNTTITSLISHNANNEISPTIVPLNIPRFRVSDLSDNNMNSSAAMSYYDKMIAAPDSDTAIHMMWVIWSFVMIISALIGVFVTLGIILSKRTRSNPFNLYILFLVIPDILISLLCASTCLSNTISGYFAAINLCYLQSFYLIFGISSNSWLNAIIAEQMFNMLGCTEYSFAAESRQQQRYKPPTHREVISAAMKVYIWSLFVASWGVMGNQFDWWPHKTVLFKGTVCIPFPTNKTVGTLFFYCVFIPSVIGLPLCYVSYALYSIWKLKLLPSNQDKYYCERRSLAVTFLRIVSIFFIMWIPTLVVVAVIGPFVNYWIVYAAGSWSHLQGLISMFVSLWKPDIYEAFINFVTCRTVLISKNRNCNEYEFNVGNNNKNEHNNWRNIVNPPKHTSASATNKQCTFISSSPPLEVRYDVKFSCQNKVVDEIISVREEEKREEEREAEIFNDDSLPLTVPSLVSLPFGESDDFVSNQSNHTTTNKKENINNSQRKSLIRKLPSLSSILSGLKNELTESNHSKKQNMMSASFKNIGTISSHDVLPGQKYSASSALSSLSSTTEAIHTHKERSGGVIVESSTSNPSTKDSETFWTAAAF